MSDQEPFEARKRLTFEQVEGVEPTPQQLKLKSLSAEFRAVAWHLILQHLEHSSNYAGHKRIVGAPWKEILHARYVLRLHKPSDEFTDAFADVCDEMKELIFNGSYVEVLGFLEFVMRRPSAPSRFDERVNKLMENAKLAYRVVDRTIIPISSEAENGTVKRAFDDLVANEFGGARQHLRKAAEELTAGNYPDSVRESVHAVESVVRVLEPSGDFSKALGILEGKVGIPPALRKGFSSIYGFTCDETGIRHPLLDDPTSEVDETDALFMIGACAAFVSYLINKARSAGVLGSKST